MSSPTPAEVRATLAARPLSELEVMHRRSTDPAMRRVIAEVAAERVAARAEVGAQWLCQVPGHDHLLAHGTACYDKAQAAEAMRILDAVEPYGALWSRQRGGPVIWAAVTVTALGWLWAALRHRIRGGRP